MSKKPILHIGQLRGANSYICAIVGMNRNRLLTEDILSRFVTIPDTVVTRKYDNKKATVHTAIKKALFQETLSEIEKVYDIHFETVQLLELEGCLEVPLEDKRAPGSKSIEIYERQDSHKLKIKHDPNRSAACDRFDLVMIMDGQVWAMDPDPKHPDRFSIIEYEPDFIRTNKDLFSRVH